VRTVLGPSTRGVAPRRVQRTRTIADTKGLRPRGDDCVCACTLRVHLMHAAAAADEVMGIAISVATAHNHKNRVLCARAGGLPGTGSQAGQKNDTPTNRATTTDRRTKRLHGNDS
jgi:hypothetical protein